MSPSPPTNDPAGTSVPSSSTTSAAYSPLSPRSGRGDVCSAIDRPASSRSTSIEPVASSTRPVGRRSMVTASSPDPPPSALEQQDRGEQNDETTDEAEQRRPDRRAARRRTGPRRLEVGRRVDLGRIDVRLGDHRRDDPVVDVIGQGDPAGRLRQQAIDHGGADGYSGRCGDRTSERGEPRCERVARLERLGVPPGLQERVHDELFGFDRRLVRRGVERYRLDESAVAADELPYRCFVAEPKLPRQGGVGLDDGGWAELEHRPRIVGRPRPGAPRPQGRASMPGTVARPPRRADAPTRCVWCRATTLAAMLSSARSVTT